MLNTGHKECTSAYDPDWPLPRTVPHWKLPLTFFYFLFWCVLEQITDITLPHMLPYLSLKRRTFEHNAIFIPNKISNNSWVRADRESIFQVQGWPGQCFIRVSPAHPTCSLVAVVVWFLPPSTSPLSSSRGTDMLRKQVSCPGKAHTPHWSVCFLEVDINCPLAPIFP